VSAFEDRQQARRDRLAGAAEKAHSSAESAARAARARMDGIPFGEPIKVGHHSEKRHRRDLERIDNSLRKSVAEQRRAEDLSSRAEAVGSAGIASDDPEAVQKLKIELANLRGQIARMKDQNKAFKKAGIEALDAEGRADHVRQARFSPGGGIEHPPYPAYALSNASANARRIEKRIEQLAKVATSEPLRIAGPDFDLEEDREEGRFILKIHGGARLSTERYEMTRAHAFLWARSRVAFVRKITPNAISAAKALGRELADSAPSGTGVRSVLLTLTAEG